MISTGTLTLILSIAGTIILLLLGVLGFFMARIISDIRKNTEDLGKTKGKIELVEQQQISDIKRIEAMTQLELKVMSENVGELSKNVNVLVTTLAKKAIESE
jgi:hypothetical protein